MLSVSNQIVECLAGIEVQRGIRVLFAAESGSRAWGFASPDSDFDVRFFYVHPIDWYLSLADQSDTIEQISPDGVFDVAGWELRKALRLLLKGNATVPEWVQSPVIYRANPQFCQTLLQLARSLYPLRGGLHHYLGTARSSLADLEGETIKLKRLFYGLRAALAAEWIARKHEIPPMEFGRLRVLVTLNTSMHTAIETLLRSKCAGIEATVCSAEHRPACEEVCSFIRDVIVRCEALTASLPVPAGARTEADDFLRTILHSAGSFA